MLVIVGKATPNKENGDVELCLRDFQKNWTWKGNLFMLGHLILMNQQ